MTTRPSRVYLFDVNETLLDLHALDPIFREVFGDETARHEWFTQLLQSALSATVIGAYTNFGTLGRTALQMIAARKGINVSDDATMRVLGAMRELPPHEDVPGALGRLKTAGVRLAALTNSTEEIGQAQIENAGLRDYFEKILSADTVRRLKPAPETYRMAAEALHVHPGDICLVAAHAWDVAGAMHAGCRAAFVARPGMVLDPQFERPQIVGSDLGQVADAILEYETASGH
ncbi:MAG: haloacid dehalogenase type II [Chloroflexota bacterium]